MSSTLERTEIIPADAEPVPARGGGSVGSVVWTLLAIAVVLVTSILIAEWIVRSTVEERVRATIVEELELPPSQLVQVGIAGPVIPQVLFGTLGEVTAFIPSVNAGPLGSDLHLTAIDARDDDDFSVAALRLESTMSAAQLSGVLFAAGVEGLDLSLGDGAIRYTFDIDPAGEAPPLTVTTEPRLAAGEVTMTITSVRVGDTTIAAADLAAQLGVDPTATVASATECAVTDIPLGATLTALGVRDDELFVTADLDPRILDDPALWAPRPCP